MYSALRSELEVSINQRTRRRRNTYLPTLLEFFFANTARILIRQHHSNTSTWHRSLLKPERTNLPHTAYLQVLSQFIYAQVNTAYDGNCTSALLQVYDT
jgi:hypothetical protein